MQYPSINIRNRRPLLVADLLVIWVTAQTLLVLMKLAGFMPLKWLTVLLPLWLPLLVVVVGGVFMLAALGCLAIVLARKGISVFELFDDHQRPECNPQKLWS